MILELSPKSPSSPSLSPPCPLFQWYPQSKEILLNLSMNADSQHLMHAQGLRVLIVVVQVVGAVKIHVAAVEALRKKEKRGWNSVYHQKFVGKTSLGPSYFVFPIWRPIMPKWAVLVPWSPSPDLTTDIFIIRKDYFFIRTIIYHKASSCWICVHGI